MIPAASVLRRDERHADRRNTIGGFSQKPAPDDEGSSMDNQPDHVRWRARKEAQERQAAREAAYQAADAGGDDITDDNWPLFGLCRQTDPDMFFPEKDGDFMGGSYRDAQKVCNSPCPVRDRCLEYALEHDERYGIWGGLTYNQRRARQGRPRRGASA